jgi:hypothetical protein
MTVFWDFAPYSLAEIDQGDCPDSRGTKHLWSVDHFLPHYTAQHIRRLSSSCSLPSEPEISIGNRITFPKRWYISAEVFRLLFNNSKKRWPRLGCVTRPVYNGQLLTFLKLLVLSAICVRCRALAQSEMQTNKRFNCLSVTNWLHKTEISKHVTQKSAVWACLWFAGTLGNCSSVLFILSSFICM